MNTMAGPRRDAAKVVCTADTSHARRHFTPFRPRSPERPTNQPTVIQLDPGQPIIESNCHPASRRSLPNLYSRVRPDKMPLAPIVGKVSSRLLTSLDLCLMAYLVLAAPKAIGPRPLRLVSPRFPSRIPCHDGKIRWMGNSKSH